MRLRLLTIVGTMALALAVPSAALAHHGRGHHHHHKSKHKAHHSNFHVRNIRPSGTTPPAPTTGTPTTPPAEENAGTVTSYEKEVLTLTLKDKSTVSGKVTADTRIKCVSPASTTTTEPPNEGPGDDNGSGDDQNGGDRNQSGGWGDHKGGDDGQWDQKNSTPEPPCDTSSLTAGTVVHSAQLRIGPSGNEWECIVLVRPSS